MYILYFEKVFKRTILKDNMKKEVRNYLSIGFLFLAVLILVYLLNLGPTGFVVFEEYENQTSCENAGYVWEDLTEQNCTTVTTCINETIDCGPCLEYEDLNGTQGDCISWSSCIEETCTDEEDCVEVVIGGQCTGDVCDIDFLELCLDETNCTEEGGYWYDEHCYDGQPVCDADFLELCLDETNCTEVGGGYWYNEVCNADVEPSCSNNLDLCEDETNCVAEGGYWYDGVCNNEQEETEETTEEEEEVVPEPYVPPTLVALLDASEISTLSLNQGSSQKATTVVTNTGTKSLFSCVVRPMGEFDSWILFSEEATDINIDEQNEFSFDVTVPEETEEGSYSLKVSIGCSEVFVEREFTVNVEKKKLEFEVISADRTRDDRVRVLYSLEELAGEDQDVTFTFFLVDANNIEVGRVEVNQSIDANSTDEFRINININESLLPINETTNETLESELALNVNFNSQIYSSSIQEKVLIGAPIGGFAVFEDIGAGEIIISLAVVLVLVFIFVFARRMRKKGKALKDLFKGKDSEPTQ
jgi:hypothetical protein